MRVCVSSPCPESVNWVPEYKDCRQGGNISSPPTPQPCLQAMFSIKCVDVNNLLARLICCTNNFVGCCFSCCASIPAFYKTWHIKHCQYCLLTFKCVMNKHTYLFDCWTRSVKHHQIPKYHPVNWFQMLPPRSTHSHQLYKPSLNALFQLRHSFYCNYIF